MISSNNRFRSDRQPLSYSIVVSPLVEEGQKSGASQSALRRVSGLIDLGAWVVNGLIALRFLLKLMAANAFL
jgi:hypothetical protein